ncbi:MAG: hypothetical protein OHK0038_17640 [Flammeovirgaceae bacterium]
MKMKKIYLLTVLYYFFSLIVTHAQYVGITGGTSTQINLSASGSPANYGNYVDNEIRPYGYAYKIIYVYQDFWITGFNTSVNLDAATLYYKTNSSTFGTADDVTWSTLTGTITAVTSSDNDRATFTFDLNSLTSLVGTEIMYYIRFTESGTNYYGFVGSTSPYTTPPTSQSQTYKLKFNPEKTYHTIRIDGSVTDDWYDTETRILSRSNNTTGNTFDITWDETYIYFLVNQGFTASSGDRICFGFDLNPGSEGNANGTTSNFGGATFPDNYRPDIIFRARGTGSSTWENDRGVANGSNGWTYTSNIGNSTASDMQSASGTNTSKLEVRIKRSAIGSFTSLGVFAWFANSSDTRYDSYPYGNGSSGTVMNIQYGVTSVGTGVSPLDDGYYDAQYETTSGTFDIFGIQTYRNLMISGNGGTTRVGALLTVNGDLTIESNAILSQGTNTAALQVNGDVNVSGTLILSSNVGGDLKIGGDFMINTGATLTHNSREIVMNGSNAQTVGGTITSFPSIGYFAVENSSSSQMVTISKPFTINTRLRLDNGILSSDATNFITLGSSATVTRTTSSTENYVDGYLAKIIDANTSFDFPVGDNGAYQPISITTNSGSTATTFKATYINSPYTNTTSLDAGLHHVSILEYWILDRTSGDRGGAVTLAWNTASDVNGNGLCNLSELRVCRFDGTQWVSAGNASTTGTCTGSGTITSTNVTSFSPFTLGSTTTNNPLPVTLSYFKGERFKDQVLLTWQTTSEFQNEGFEVQKSINGIDFEKIGFVQGKGTTKVKSDYSFTVIENDDAYFRLKQLNTDGKFEYSNIIYVSRNQYRENVLNIYPNPSISFVNLDWKGEKEYSESASLSLFNQLGQKLWQQEGSLRQIEQDFNRKLHSFEKGMYFIKAVCLDKEFTFKWIKN